MNETLRDKIMESLFPYAVVKFFITDGSKRSLSAIGSAKNTATNLQADIRKKYRVTRPFTEKTFIPNIQSAELATVQGSVPDLKTWDKDLELSAVYGAFNKFATDLLDAHHKACDKLRIMHWTEFLTKEEIEEFKRIKEIPTELKALKDSLAKELDKVSAAVAAKKQNWFQYNTQEEISAFLTAIKEPAIIKLLQGEITEHLKLRPKEVKMYEFNEEKFKASILSSAEAYEMELQNQIQIEAGNAILFDEKKSRNPRAFLATIANADYVQYVKKNDAGETVQYTPILKDEDLDAYIKAFYETQGKHRTAQQSSNGLGKKVTDAVLKEKTRLDAHHALNVEHYNREFGNWNDEHKRLSELLQIEISNYSDFCTLEEKKLKELAETRRKAIVEAERHHSETVLTEAERFKTIAENHRNEFDVHFGSLGIHLPGNKETVNSAFYTFLRLEEEVKVKVVK